MADEDRSTLIAKPLFGIDGSSLGLSEPVWIDKNFIETNCILMVGAI